MWWGWWMCFHKHLHSFSLAFSLLCSRLVHTFDQVGYSPGLCLDLSTKVCFQPGRLRWSYGQLIKHHLLMSPVCRSSPILLYLSLFVRLPQESASLASFRKYVSFFIIQWALSVYRAETYYGFWILHRFKYVNLKEEFSLTGSLRNFLHYSKGLSSTTEFVYCNPAIPPTCPWLQSHVVIIFWSFLTKPLSKTALLNYLAKKHLFWQITCIKNKNPYKVVLLTKWWVLKR